MAPGVPGEELPGRTEGAGGQLFRPVCDAGGREEGGGDSARRDPPRQGGGAGVPRLQPQQAVLASEFYLCRLSHMDELKELTGNTRLPLWYSFFFIYVVATSGTAATKSCVVQVHFIPTKLQYTIFLSCEVVKRTCQTKAQFIAVHSCISFKSLTFLKDKKSPKKTLFLTSSNWMISSGASWKLRRHEGLISFYLCSTKSQLKVS